MESLNTGSERVGILVLGMHRSGTSALTRVLSLLGADLPKTLMAANDTNAAGHWESEVISRLDNRILQSAGSHWDDWLEFNPLWVDSPKAAEFRQEARAAIEREFGSSHLFVLKDPRICRFARFWIETLREAGVRPVVVSSLRNPLEVAASLEKRSGVDPQLGHLLWLRHVLDAERSTRGTPRIFVGYDGLMTSWGRIVGDAQAKLGLAFPRVSALAASEVGAFLSADHRHHESSPARVVRDLTLSSWLRETYATLDRWAESGESEDDYATLDRIRGELNGAGPALGRLIASGRQASAAMSGLTQRLAEAEAETAAERQRLEAESAAERQKLEAESAAERQRLEAESAAERQRREASERELAELLPALKETRDRLAQTESALAQRRHEADETRAELAVAEEELQTLRAADAAGRARIEALQAELVKVTSELGSKEALLDEKTRVIASLEQEIERARSAGAAAEAKREKLERGLSERFDEIAKLTKLVRDREGDVQRGEAKSDRLRQAAAGQLGRAVTALLNGKRWPLLPKSVRRRRKMALLERSGLFDADWYLRKYRDVAEAGMDPLQHYVQYGAAEGREPNATLATARGGKAGGESSEG